jgi:hypothetical protein
MITSNLGFRLGLLLAFSAPCALLADDLTLESDARLTGTVRSINEAGVIELSSVLSPEPVLLKSGAVSKVEFSASERRPGYPGMIVELTNGDLLPAAIESLDEKTLNIATLDAGQLSVPRTALKTLQLGVHQRKVIYSGPLSLEEWILDGGDAMNWKFLDKSLTSNGSGGISRNFETPRQFILKFTLKWQANPRFKIYFADPLAEKGAVVDRYFMQYNSAGLEIKRESVKGQRFPSVILLPRTPDQYPNNQIDVEIRVDRKASRIHLFINGEPEGAGVDPVGNAPVGNGITLVSSASSGEVQEIRNLEILELDNAGARHRSEDRGNPKNDSLISRDEDRWSGHLTGIRKGAEGAVFSFKSDFQAQPLELAEADVSTVFFANPQPSPSPPAKLFTLRLFGGGSLRVSSCTFSDSSITASHPLLGVLKINRGGVLAIDYLDSKPKPKPKPAE